VNSSWHNSQREEVSTIKNKKKCFICEYFYPKQEMYFATEAGWLCEACFCDQWDGLCPRCGHESEDVMQKCPECAHEFYIFPAPIKR